MGADAEPEFGRDRALGGGVQSFALEQGDAREGELTVVGLVGAGRHGQFHAAQAGIEAQSEGVDRHVGGLSVHHHSLSRGCLSVAP